MNIFHVLGFSIAESISAVGQALRGLGGSSESGGGYAATQGWAEQFSAASLVDRRGRRTADALYRAATVRL